MLEKKRERVTEKGQRERERGKVNVITVVVAATIVTSKTDEENGSE